MFAFTKWSLSLIGFCLNLSLDHKYQMMSRVGICLEAIEQKAVFEKRALQVHNFIVVM